MEALRAIYRYWVAIVFLGVLAQIAASGYGAFYASDKLSDQSGPDERKIIDEETFDEGFGFHVGFGYLLFLATVLVFLLALAGRLGRPRIWWNLALPVLMVVQILLAGAGEDVPFVGSFHPVNALLIFGLAGSLAWREWSRSAVEADVAAAGSPGTPR